MKPKHGGNNEPHKTDSKYHAGIWNLEISGILSFGGCNVPKPLKMILMHP